MFRHRLRLPFGHAIVFAALAVLAACGGSTGDHNASQRGGADSQRHAVVPDSEPETDPDFDPLRAQVEAEAFRLRSELIDKWPDRFGGQYYRGTTGDTLSFGWGVVDLKPADQEWFASINRSELSDRFSIASVTYSEAELTEAATDIVLELDENSLRYVVSSGAQLELLADGTISQFIDLRVVSDAPAELREQLIAADSLGRVRLREEGKMRSFQPACTPTSGTRFSHSPYYGAEASDHPGGCSSMPPGDCTTSFTYVNAFGYFGSTAGHCSPGTGAARWVRTGDPAQPADYFRSNHFSTYSPGDLQIYSDTAMFSLGAAGIFPSAELLVGNGGKRHVVGRTNDWRGVGNRSCFLGRRATGHRCGTVDRSNQTVPIQTGSGNMMLQAECIVVDSGYLTAQEGDSGGPVYWVPFEGTAFALGTVAGGDPAMRSMCYSLVPFTVLFHGAEVFTNT